MSRDDNDDRGSRRSSRDDDRPRSRDRDDPPARRSSRDDDPPARSRDRDDDPPRRARSRDDGDDRGSSRSGYTYQKRSDEDTRARATNNDKYDKYIDGSIKTYKPRDGLNVIRIVPPTWEGAKHYGYDIWVHWGVGADRQTYLDLNRMKDLANAYFEAHKMPLDGGRDPVEEEVAEMLRAGDEKEAKEAKAKKRVGIYLIDRKAEQDGVQFWAMPDGEDRELVQLSVDERSGKALALDDPEEGFDVSFTKTGQMKNTEYTAWKIARDSSPLGGRGKWLDWAVDHPIPSMLRFFTREHISNILGGGGSHRGRDDRGSDERDSRDRSTGRSADGGSRSDGRDDRSSRSEGRGEARDSSHDGRGRGDERADAGSRRRSEPEHTWASVHEMSGREMEDLVDAERLKLDPGDFREDEDLADAICEEMDLRKPSSRREMPKDDSVDDKLAAMRKRRSSGD